MIEGVPPTKTIKLKTGYRDVHGVTHKSLIIRAPLADDEIKADATLVKMRVGNNEQQRYEARSMTMSTLALVAQCSIQLGTIMNPQLDHFRAMPRLDVLQVIQEFTRFEEQVYGATAGEEQEEDDDGNPPQVEGLGT